MRRLVAIVLAFAFAFLGTGIVQAAHRQQHQREGQSHTPCCPNDHSSPDRKSPAHDDSQCQVCVQMHQPVYCAAWELPIVVVTLLAGCTAPAPDSAVKSAVMQCIVCRGPPQRSVHN